MGDPVTWGGLASIVVVSLFTLLNKRESNRHSDELRELRLDADTAKTDAAKCRSEHEATKVELKKCGDQHTATEARLAAIEAKLGNG